MLFWNTKVWLLATNLNAFLDFQDPRELTILSLRREVKLLRMENTYLRQQVKNTAGSVKLDKVKLTTIIS